MKPIWIVDDDPSIRFVLEKALAREQLAVRSFANPRELLAALDAGDEPQVLVSDIRMPGMPGIELLAKVKARLPGLPVIVMTAYSDLDSAVSAFQGGAFEYLPKPFDLTKAVELIRRAIDESLREDVRDSGVAEMPEMLGQAPAMQDVFRAIGRLAQSSVTVLITGESGSGKELVARALHKHSPRGDQGNQGPFVAINTAAIPKDLLESELFGHERGAFTGAQTTRRGRFEQADGGTLFLDEIGDMPLDLQTRLLRVLSDGQFYRVGGHQPLKSNVRVIAATHQNLEQRVRQGVFREDLYHRLNVIRLRLPPLRERREDIPTLTRFFLAKQRQGTRRRGQAHQRRCARAPERLRLSGQRAPAGEPLPLADRDGAGAGGARPRTCRPNCRRRGAATRPPASANAERRRRRRQPRRPRPCRRRRRRPSWLDEPAARGAPAAGERRARGLGQR